MTREKSATYLVTLIFNGAGESDVLETDPVLLRPKWLFHNIVQIWILKIDQGVAFLFKLASDSILFKWELTSDFFHGRDGGNSNGRGRLRGTSSAWTLTCPTWTRCNDRRDDQRCVYS